VRGLVPDAITSFFAGAALAVFLMPVGDHASQLAFYVAWPVLFVVARLARSERRRNRGSASG
jgi:hypothetical protein